MAEQGSESGDLTASMIMSSDVLYDLCCDLCSEDGHNYEADGFCIDCGDYLCKDCVKGHKKNKASRDHTVQDKTQMPRQKPSPVAPKASKGACTEKCANHPTRLVEYYCRDDKTLGCSVCMTMNHRLCESVDHIPDVSENLLDSQEYKQFTSTLTNLKTKAQNVTKRSTENVTKAENCVTDAADAMQELRKQMNKVFDKFEGDLRKKAEAIKHADIKKMKDNIDKGNTVYDEVEKILANLQSLQSKNQLGQLFIQMIKLEETVKKLLRFLADADADNSVTAYIFETAQKVQEILADPSSIGQLSIEDSAGAGPTPSSQQPTIPSRGQQAYSARSKSATVTAETAKDPMDMQAVFVKDINVKTDSDAIKCQIFASEMIPDNKLIVTDINNKKVKLLNLDTSKVTSEVKMSSTPWDIAKLAGYEVAVTLTRDKKITFVEVSDTGSLKLGREISTGGECTAVLHRNGKLVVAFKDPVKIELMLLDGTVERKIQQPNLFKVRSHMALSLSHETIYVADRDGECLKKITLDGSVLAEYRDMSLKGPRGLAVDQYGRVLACGAVSHNIHMLSPDLKHIKVLVKGLDIPMTLTYCQSKGRLYVGQFDNTLKVYALYRTS